MNSIQNMLRLMTHVNIGAIFALLAWVTSHITSKGGV
jgi:hypothetical protein